jgi:cytidylate kinase
VANVAGVDPKVAANPDERAHRWWEWIVTGFSYAAPYAYNSPDQARIIDENFLQDITMRLIQRAADSGKCVIVGRGAQCVLQGRVDVLNIFAYAPIDERIQRLRVRRPDCADYGALINRVDSERASYIRQFHRRNWLDKSLYDLCINTALGLEVAAELITTAISRAKPPRNTTNQQSHDLLSGDSSQTGEQSTRTW